MKNLQIVSNGNKDVSIIDTFLLKRLLDCYKSNLISVNTSDLVDSHIDRLRSNGKDMKAVMRLNKEFNDLQIFHEMLMQSDGDCYDLQIFHEMLMQSDGDYYDFHDIS